MLTVNGSIRVERERYVVRQADRPHEGVELTALPVVGDDPGQRSKVTRGVRELMCRVHLGARSFADAAELLEHTARLSSSAERLRQVVEREGKAVQRLQQRGEGCDPAVDRRGMPRRSTFSCQPHHQHITARR